MIVTFKKLLFLLSSNERKKMFLLIFMLIVMALIDMIGVASIMPFLVVLSDPDIINTNNFLNSIYNLAFNFGVKTHKEFVFLLGISVFIFLTLSLSFKAFTFYLQQRFVTMRSYSIGKALIENYLNQPYKWFLNRHSAELSKNILSDITIIVGSGIGPMINLVAHGSVVITLITLLILADPRLAIIICLTLGASYGVIYKFTRGLLLNVGQKRHEGNQLRFKSTDEAFGAVKQVKVSGLENFYVKRYSDPAHVFSNYSALLGAIALLPRYIIEIIIFGGMLLVILYLMAQNDSFVSIVPIIALYAFAGYRLMPALQQLYASISQLRSVVPTLDLIYNDLKNFKKKNIKTNTNKTIKLKNKITLKNICYNYPNTERTALKDININIPAKSTVALVGATGSGKSTTADIILGLLEAQKGTLEVDDEVINKDNTRAWQNSIGYVPQHIYLSDDTIAANISFGVEKNKQNMDNIESAAKIASIHDFIINDLPEKYQTKVGERGIRLSGGQRQRIGIARALYHNPSILILDEATSSLDNLTEQEVMNSIQKISKNLTVILIAHRLSTVKNCDTIFLLEKGQITAEGSFEELAKINDSFKKNALNL